MKTLLAVLSAFCSLWLVSHAHADPGSIEVYATGLYNPKDFEFDMYGNLYVAESGIPGTVIIPLPAQYGSKGPVGYGGRISRIDTNGKREDWVTGIPNLGIYSGGELLGPSGMALLDHKLYLVQAAHLTESPHFNEVMPDHKLRRISDVGAFNKKHLASEDNGDAVPTGNPYDLIAWQGALYFSDGNYNQIVKAGLDGKLEIFAKSPRQTTVTGMAVGPDGYLYVAQFGNAPYYAGSGKVDRVSPDGKWESGFVQHLQNPLGVAFDSKGTLYVLQFASLFSPARLKYLPYGGQVLRVEKDGRTTPVVTDLTYPTFMKFDAADNLWVTNYGNSSSKGEGQILKIRLGEHLLKGPRIVPPTDTPTPEVLQAESEARAKLALMNEQKAKSDPKNQIIKIIENVDTMKWGYDPAVTHVKGGDTITILNTGRSPHTATSTRGVFDTGFIPSGETRQIKIPVKGTLDFLCTPHPWMKGKIIAEGGDVPQLSDDPTKPSGAANPNEEAPKPKLVSSVALAALFAALVGLTLVVAFTMRKKEH